MTAGTGCSQPRPDILVMAVILGWATVLMQERSPALFAKRRRYGADIKGTASWGT